MKKYIDLRSDTVTKPSPAMLNAMMIAQVGDDILGDDPTVQELEQLAAKMTGKEAAVFAPSGTQSNLMGVMAHCQRGDEYISGQEAHIFKWEGGGAAVLGSINPQPIEFESDGTLLLSKVKEKIKPLNDDHYAKTKLLCIENTQRGKVLPLNYFKEVKDFCKENKLSSHLDGARVFNASVHLGIDVKEITQHFDTVSICLSKGLGAPIGSLLCGSPDLIRSARRWRKVLGGGMRQAGIIAAAGIYALKNNIDRLSEDHENAARLAQGLKEIPGLPVTGNYTNMVFVKVPEHLIQPLYIHLQNFGIRIIPKASLRLVTHCDITRDDIDTAIHVFKDFFKNNKLSS